MGGGLLQLVAYGAQDAYITGNPQITFWKGLFKRHTNFAMEPFRINMSGQVQWGTKQTALVGRHADLLFSTYLEVVLPKDKTVDNVTTNFLWNNSGSKSSNSLGFNLVRYAELDIGGQVVDRLYGEFMYIWGQLTNEYVGIQKLAQMVTNGQTNNPAIMPNGSGCSSQGRQFKANVIYVPIPFFFTRNPGAALPLIALQYHEVKINILWNDLTQIVGDFRSPDPAQLPTQCALYIDYIYLDTEERRRMAQASHEYLIEQTQYNEDKGIVGPNARVDLTFNHPVKELIWVIQPSYRTDCRIAAQIGETKLSAFDFSDDPVYEQWIQINGQDRLSKRYGTYYNRVQSYQHHTGMFPGPGVYGYSFAIRPEEHQPSGTCNFSRIDTATIVITMAGDNAINKVPDSDNWNVRVYAINYNVLRVMSGMGGLAYSN
jgi:hypothetical protein